LPAKATHAELIGIYIWLLKNPEFVNEVEKIGNFENAVDPVTAIAEALGKGWEAAGKIFSGNVRTTKMQQEMQEDAFFAQVILAKQGGDNTGKILLFSGVALVVVGVIITVIILKRKK
jgi:predicted acyltransferase